MPAVALRRIPGATPPVCPAPPPPARPRSAGLLRRSLRASTAEGVAAEIVGACAGGAALTGWALHLGCGTATLAALGALPFVAQVFQLPGAWLTARLGARRTALWSVALSREALLPLVALPFLPVSAGAARAILVTVAVASQALALVCNNAWVSWMGDLVPAAVRGRYFGRRTGVTTIAAAAAGVAAGAALDAAGAARGSGAPLAALALVACVAGAVSVWLMARQHEPAAAPRTPVRPAALLAPLRHPPARRIAAFLCVWSLAQGLSAPLYNVHVLRDLRLGFVVLGVQAALAAAARAASSAAWGRAIDRAGAGRVLSVCSAALAASPLLWIGAAYVGPWLLAADALVVGGFSGGHAVAALAAPLAATPAPERPAWTAAFAVAGGVAFGAGTLAASALTGGAPAAARLAPLAPAFLLSGAVRLVAAALALRIAAPPRDTRALPRALRPVP